jgi:hypothetical protein
MNASATYERSLQRHMNEEKVTDPESEAYGA